ncbi:MAG TPA: hypothetical protein VIH59_36735, partial [Candidatus Tectomicrobia bacterium]
KDCILCADAWLDLTEDKCVGRDQLPTCPATDTNGDCCRQEGNLEALDLAEMVFDEEYEACIDEFVFRGLAPFVTRPR